MNVKKLHTKQNYKNIFKRINTINQNQKEEDDKKIKKKSQKIVKIHYIYKTKSEIQKFTSWFLLELFDTHSLSFLTKFTSLGTLIFHVNFPREAITFIFRT